MRIWGGFGGGVVYTEHLGGAGSFLGALGEGDFNKVVEGSRPWKKEAKFWGEGPETFPIRPSTLALPSLSPLPPTICLFPLAGEADSHSWS